MKDVRMNPISKQTAHATIQNALLRARHLIFWNSHRRRFSQEKSEDALPFLYFSHQTPLFRRLRNVEMHYYYEKIVNLGIAVRAFNGLLLRPGEVFSFWKLLGEPTSEKGYVDGMVLDSGSFGSGLGGGLGQLSNLIYWLTLHTPLTVLERYRHPYDVFPDADRTQPFGSGATCIYPFRDLCFRNNTQDTYQLRLSLGQTELAGEWRISSPPASFYDVYESEHLIRQESWGGYSRHNELRRKCLAEDGSLISDAYLLENHALMMYSPYRAELDSGIPPDTIYRSASGI